MKAIIENLIIRPETPEDYKQTEAARLCVKP